MQPFQHQVCFVHTKNRLVVLTIAGFRKSPSATHRHMDVYFRGFVPDEALSQLRVVKDGRLRV